MVTFLSPTFPKIPLRKLPLRSDDDTNHRYDTIMPILKAYFTQRGLIRIFGKSRKNWGKGSFPRVDRKRERERGGKGKKDNSIILSFKTLMWTIVVQVIYDVLTCLGRTAHGLAAWRIDGASKFLSYFDKKISKRNN